LNYTQSNEINGNQDEWVCSSNLYLTEKGILTKRFLGFYSFSFIRDGVQTENDESILFNLQGYILNNSIDASYYTVSNVKSYKCNPNAYLDFTTQK